MEGSRKPDCTRKDPQTQEYKRGCQGHRHDNPDQNGGKPSSLEETGDSDVQHWREHQQGHTGEILDGSGQGLNDGGDGFEPCGPLDKLLPLLDLEFRHVSLCRHQDLILRVPVGVVDLRRQGLVLVSILLRHGKFFFSIPVMAPCRQDTRHAMSSCSPFCPHHLPPASHMALTTETQRGCFSFLGREAIIIMGFQK